MKTLFAFALIAFSSTSAFAGERSINCFGTEPFWGIKLTSKTLKYSDPKNLQGMQLAVTSKRGANGVAEDVAFVVKTKNTSLTVVLGECSDGMSDNKYSHHAVYEIGGEVLYGCCDLE